MAFKTSQDGHGGYADTSLMWINANNSFTKGYDNTTLTSSQTKIVAFDGATNDEFGHSVAIGSGRIVVGAIHDDVGASETDAGTVYVFDIDGILISKLEASDAKAFDEFGWSVAAGSGRIVVGARGNDDAGSLSGSAYIFDLNGNELAKITASDAAAGDQFGFAVAIGSDRISDRIVVGAPYNDDNGPNSGSAYIFDLNGNELAKITASDAFEFDEFGGSVAVGSGRIVVGAYADGDNGPQSGSAYIFDLNGNELAKITASDGDASYRFAGPIAVGSGRIVVGSNGHLFNRGAAYIFDLNGNELTKITAPDFAANDYFGTSVSIGSGRIVVGAYADDDAGSSSGSAYIFDLDGNYLEKITASDGAAGDDFGFSAAAGSGKVIIGARHNTNSGGTEAGAVYMYDIPYSPKHILDILD